MQDHPLASYAASSGTFEPVWRLEIQTIADDVDRLLDAISEVHPLRYGIYERNASVSAVGYETAKPMAGSTTATHVDGFEPGTTEEYPMVELKISFERDLDVLKRIMDVVLHHHHYEQPAVYLRDEWASQSVYDTQSNNANRWWNNGRGLPDRLS